MGGFLSQADKLLKMFWYVEAIKLINISELTVSLALDIYMVLTKCILQMDSLCRT